MCVVELVMWRVFGYFCMVCGWVFLLGFGFVVFCVYFLGVWGGSGIEWGRKVCYFLFIFMLRSVYFFFDIYDCVICLGKIFLCFEIKLV